MGRRHLVPRGDLAGVPLHPGRRRDVGRPPQNDSCLSALGLPVVAILCPFSEFCEMIYRISN